MGCSPKYLPEAFLMTVAELGLDGSERDQATLTLPTFVNFILRCPTGSKSVL